MWGIREVSLSSKVVPGRQTRKERKAAVHPGQTPYPQPTPHQLLLLRHPQKDRLLASVPTAPQGQAPRQHAKPLSRLGGFFGFSPLPPH